MSDCRVKTRQGRQACDPPARLRRHGADRLLHGTANTNLVLVVVRALPPGGDTRAALDGSSRISCSSTLLNRISSFRSPQPVAVRIWFRCIPSPSYRVRSSTHLRCRVVLGATRPAEAQALLARRKTARTRRRYLRCAISLSASLATCSSRPQQRAAWRVVTQMSDISSKSAVMRGHAASIASMRATRSARSCCPRSLCQSLGVGFHIASKKHWPRRREILVHKMLCAALSMSAYPESRRVATNAARGGALAECSGEAITAAGDHVIAAKPTTSPTRLASDLRPKATR